MPRPIEADVRTLLAPREGAITQVVLDAWGRWWRNPERPTLYRRTRACLVHNYIMNAAPAAFTADRGVHLIQRQETIYFLIERRLLMRFKKGDEQGLSSNIETQASLAFVDPTEPLIDLPDVARVDIAYVLNQLETVVHQVAVVARDGDRKVWSYPLYARDDRAATVPLPVRPLAPAPADSVVRLPPSDEAAKKNQG